MTSLRKIYPRHYHVPVLTVLAACLLYVGISLPILTVKQMMFMKSTFSVVSGIEGLRYEGNYWLAAIIFVFSILFPFFKLLALLGIWFFEMTDDARRRFLGILEALGKWSMLDVFVVAIVIVAVKFGWMTGAKPEVGVYVFAAAVILSMILTEWIGRLARKGLKVKA